TSVGLVAPQQVPCSERSLMPRLFLHRLLRGCILTSVVVAGAGVLPVHRAAADILSVQAPGCDTTAIGRTGFPGFEIDGDLLSNRGGPDWLVLPGISSCTEGSFAGPTVFVRDATWCGSSIDNVFGSTGNKDQDCIGPLGAAGIAPWTF